MDATIVHLSDLHFKNDAENLYRLRRLRDDLGRLQSQTLIHTVFTGDLVQAGDENRFDLLFDELISPLLELGHEVFVVPGNHDVQRAVADRSFVDQVLADRGSGYLFDDHAAIRTDYPKQEYNSLLNYSVFEDLFGPYDQKSYWGYAVTRGSVSVLGLNSAWLCCARSDGTTDRGALRVEPAVLERLTQSLPPDTLRVALLHHPLDWLEETTRSAVNDLLVRHMDLVLFGHVHATDFMGQVKDSSSCLFLQAPPLRAGWSKGTNGYAIIRADVAHKRFEVEYRSYSKPRREFVLGEDFARGGRLHPRPEDAEFFRTSPPQSALLRRYIEAEPIDYLNWYRSNIRSKSRVTGSFVIPKAHRVTASDESQLYSPPQEITKIVSSSKRSQFFVAPLDAGSTTAAYLTIKHLSDNFVSHLQVPAYFDAARETINKASILRAISQTTPLRYSHSEVERLAEDGSVVTVVDGLCLGDVDQFNLFRDTADRHLPNVRFIYFLSTERHGVSATGVGEPRLSYSDDEIYEFSQLEIDDIRSMISLRVPDKAEAIRENVVSHVVESFRQMDEPIFASTVAIVIETITQDPEFKPLNKARLIERYVECLLGRFDLEDVQEGSFSSSDKINFLSFIARRLLELNQVGLVESDWHGFSLEYQTRYLIELPKGLLKEVLEKGIMTMEGGQITFRGDALFSFFVAQQMKRDTAFAATLVEGSGIFRHYREITVYGELEGINVGDVLEILFQELNQIEGILLENYAMSGVDLTDEWRATCAETLSDATSKALYEAADRLGSTNATVEAADRHDNAELARISRHRGVAERQEVLEAEARLLVGIRLYGLLLKNAFHVEASEKLRHLKKLCETAELWVGVMCAHRTAIARYPLVIAGGVHFINRGAAINPERSYQEFKFNAPNTASRLIASTLRNPQLAIAIRALMNQLTAMGRLFARDILLEMPSQKNREAFLSSFEREENINIITCELRTLRIRYLSAGRHKDRREYLESIVTTVAKYPQISARFDLLKLKRARMVQDLREKSTGANP